MNLPVANTSIKDSVTKTALLIGSILKKKVAPSAAAASARKQ